MQGMLLKKTKNMKNMTDKVTGEKVLFTAVDMADLVSELPEEVQQDLRIPSYLCKWRVPHWGENPMMQFVPFATGRKPVNVLEWAKCVWNIDIFVYRVPVLKLLGLMALAGWLL